MPPTFLSAQYLLYGDTGYDSHVLRLLLCEKNLDYHNILLKDRPEELAELNPYRTLPILVNRELSLYEPNVILEYLEERHPAVKLLPSTPKERSQVRLLAWRIQKDWLTLARELLTHPDSFNETQAKHAKKTLSDTLLTLSPVFLNKPFFLSDALTWCDILLMPMFHRLDEMALDLPKHLSRGIMDYYHRLSQRDGFINSIDPKNTIDWEDFSAS